MTALLAAIPTRATEIETAAQTLVEQLAAGKFTEATARFDAQMRESLPPEKLTAVWQGLEAKAGKYRGVKTTTTQLKGAFRVVVLGCTFEKMPLDTKVVFDAAGNISGLYFAPQVAEWQPPDYASPAQFDERPVTVKRRMPWKSGCVPAGAVSEARSRISIRAAPLRSASQRVCRTWPPSKRRTLTGSKPLGHSGSLPASKTTQGPGRCMNARRASLRVLRSSPTCRALVLRNAASSSGVKFAASAPRRASALASWASSGRPSSRSSESFQPEAKRSSRHASASPLT
jgi:hypothetical protein